MNVTMNMSNYEIEPETIEVEYSDEILYAGWNPEVDSVCQQLQLVPTTEQRAMPATLTAEVVELFLRKMYSYRR
jgi:hypothetical protein